MKRVIPSLLIGTMLASLPASAQQENFYFRFKAGSGTLATNPGGGNENPPPGDTDNQPEMTVSVIGFPANPLVNDPVSAQVVVSNYVGSVSFQITNGAPPNNLHLSSTGGIDGQFLTPGSFSFTIQVRDSSGRPPKSVTLSGTVDHQAPAVAINGASGLLIPGAAFSTQAYTTNGASVRSWSLSGAPDGFQIASDGTITGIVPDQAGFDLTAIAEGPTGKTGSATRSFTVHAASASVSPGSQTITEGESATFTGTATNMAGAAWRLTGAPAWLAVNGNTFSGGPTADVTAPQTYTVTATAEQGGASRSDTFSLTVEPATAAVALSSTSILVGSSVTGTTTTTLDGATFALEGAPEWMTINAATGAISTREGGATEPATNVRVVASKGAFRATSAPFSVRVEATATVSDVTVTEGALVDITADSNMKEATWTLTGAPAWLRVDGNRFTGSPDHDVTEVETHAITATAEQNGVTQTAEFTVTVNPAKSTLTLAPLAVYSGQTVSGTARTGLGSGATYELVNAPSWLVINPATGAITSAAGGATASASNIRVKATKTVNGVALNADESPAVNVTVTEPTATVSQTAVTVVEGNDVSLSLGTNMAGAVWTLSGNPAWLTVSGNMVTGTAADVDALQTYTVKATATKDGARKEVTFTVTVEPGTVVVE